MLSGEFVRPLTRAGRRPNRFITAPQGRASSNACIVRSAVAREKCIAVVDVFQLALFKSSETYVVTGRKEKQAPSVSATADGLDLPRRCFLFRVPGDQVRTP